MRLSVHSRVFACMLRVNILKVQRDERVDANSAHLFLKPANMQMLETCRVVLAKWEA